MGNSSGKEEDDPRKDMPRVRNVKDYSVPKAKSQIKDQAINRQTSVYQYGLFCVTELAKLYLNGDHPHDLGDNWYDWYRERVFLLEQDLSFDELKFTNYKFDSELDFKAKSSILDLTKYYVERSTLYSRNKTSSRMQELLKSVQSEIFQSYYEEVVAALINDIERKECFDMNRAIKDQEFRLLIQQKDKWSWSKIQDQFPSLKQNVLVRQLNKKIASDVAYHEKQTKLGEGAPVVDSEERRIDDLMRRSKPVHLPSIRHMLNSQNDPLDEDLQSLILNFIKRKDMSQGEAERLIKDVGKLQGYHSDEITSEQLLLIMSW